MGGFEHKAPDRFTALTDPARWTHILRDYAHGAHWPHAVENLTHIVVAELSAALFDLDLRHTPRIALSSHGNGNGRAQRILSISCGKRRTYLAISLGDQAVMIDGDPIYLANSEGPLILVRVLVREIAKLWNGFSGR